MRLTDAQYFSMKEQILDWILRIDESESIPKGIKVLHFSLFEPCSIELIGSKVYSTDDDDWTFRDDFIPEENILSDLDIDENIDSSYLLKVIVRILKEITQENKEIEILKVPFVTTGFADREVVSIR